MKPLPEELFRNISRLLPPNLPAEIRDNLRAAVESALARMNLVTREEFEVQKKVLERTRKRLETLEQQLRDLESG